MRGRKDSPLDCPNYYLVVQRNLTRCPPGVCGLILRADITGVEKLSEPTFVIGMEMRIFSRIYRASLEDIVQKLLLRKQLGLRPPNRYISKQFLKTAAYHELMSRHLPYDGSYDLHEAQNQTANFRFRHFEAKDKLGIFRWRGIQQNLAYLLDVTTDPDNLVLDFGGAACPLGFDSKIVDLAKHDAWHRAVPYRRLSEVGDQADVIFSSHCLEHILDIEVTIEEMVHQLKKSGIVILHLPAFSCERWRAGIHRDYDFGDHLWTFGLEGTAVPGGLDNYVCVDALLDRFLSIEKAEYCGDNSIFIIGRKY